MHPLRPFLLALAACLWWGLGVPSASADSIETFALDGNDSQSLDGDTLTVTLADLSIGAVSFDAVLTVVGSSDLNQLSSGLGVDGGSNPINDGESLTFSLGIQNESGGSVAFDGFTEVDLTFFGAEGEQAIFSEDASLATTSDNFFTAEGSDDDPADISGTQPTVFTLFGNDDGGTVSFRVDSIAGEFRELVPVPEPSTLVLLAGGLALAALRRRRHDGQEAGRSAAHSRTSRYS